MRRCFTNSFGVGEFSALICVIGLIPARLSAQDSIMDRTTFGQSQNDARDLANSLVPGEKRWGKGEKKVEVNSGELKSKTVKDTTFGGSLLNMGIVGAEPKLDESKRPAVKIENDSASEKQSAAIAKEPLLQLSDEALLREHAEQSAIAGENRQPTTTNGNAGEAAGSETHQKPQSAATSEASTSQQSATTSSEKPAKPDGDH